MKTLLKKELIGLHLEVVDADNKSVVSTKGKIADETKNMIILDNNKMLQKQCVKFNIFVGDKVFLIDGKTLVCKPEDRLKMVVNDDA